MSGSGGRVVGIHILQRSQLKNKSKVSCFLDSSHLVAVLRVLKFALISIWIVPEAGHFVAFYLESLIYYNYLGD